MSSGSGGARAWVELKDDSAWSVVLLEGRDRGKEVHTVLSKLVTDFT